MPLEAGAGPGEGASHASDSLPSPLCWPDSPQPLPDYPVGGRLRHFWERWQQMGAHDWVVSILRRGYNLQFRQKPPLSDHPTIQSSSKDPLRTKILEDIVGDLLQKRAIEEVKDTHSPGFYSRLFFVQKKTGGHRPVIDLSTLNTFLLIPKFKMETIHSIRQSLQTGSWTYSVDLKDAYFHVPIHPASRKYLRFTVGDGSYQFTALPFGLSTAPYIFTKVVMEVKRLFHSHNKSLYQYLDDWLGESPSRQIAHQESQELSSLCLSLGLLINWSKSDLIPTQEFLFLGALFNLEEGWIRPSQESFSNLCRITSRFLSRSSASAQAWQSLLGTLTSIEKFVPLGRLHMRPFQWHLSRHWNQSSQPQETQVPIPSEIKEALTWWTSPHNVLRGAPLHPPAPTLRIFTDASTQGWGAHAGESTIQGIWSPQEQTLHINTLEMRAISLALQHFNPPPRSHVLVATDNSSVVYYINKQGGTRSWSLWTEAQDLFRITDNLGISIRARHIPGRLNVIADQLSRAGQILPTEWSLHEGIVQSLFGRWGPPNIDLFATRYNKKCPVFVSPVPDPLALEADALSISWEGMSAYAYPPHQILTQVLSHFRKTHSCRLILVAPHWPAQMWFKTLQELAVEPPVQLPTGPRMLRQPQSDVYHSEPDILQLHAWLLVRQPSGPKDTHGLLGPE